MKYEVSDKKPALLYRNLCSVPTRPNKYNLKALLGACAYSCYILQAFFHSKVIDELALSSDEGEDKEVFQSLQREKTQVLESIIQTSKPVGVVQRCETRPGLKPFNFPVINFFRSYKGRNFRKYNNQSTIPKETKLFVWVEQNYVFYTLFTRIETPCRDNEILRDLAPLQERQDVSRERKRRLRSRGEILEVLGQSLLPNTLQDPLQERQLRSYT